MSTIPPPGSPIRYDDLPPCAADRRVALVDSFGRWLFWLRTRALTASEELTEQRSAREVMGSLRRRVYDRVASLSPEQRLAALSLAQDTLDGFLERLLWALGDEGVDNRFDDEYAYRFRVHIEIVDVASGAIVEDAPVNRGGSFFGRNWGRWLNQFSGGRDGVT